MQCSDALMVGGCRMMGAGSVVGRWEGAWDVFCFRNTLPSESWVLWLFMHRSLCLPVLVPWVCPAAKAASQPWFKGLHPTAVAPPLPLHTGGTAQLGMGVPTSPWWPSSRDRTSLKRKLLRKP